ncbi:MAG: VacB/RNase II family 3'-5' exoribonuclease, partial [Clostridia bacterium]|nr:VacB/RNase II family 3'-5' exoribonuclease [Clostridia bacterium]
MNAKETLLSHFLSGELSSGATLNQVARFLDVPPRERKRLKDLLDSLVEDGHLFVGEYGNYGTAEALGLIKGKINGNERGFAFLIPDDKTAYPEDFFIPHKGLNGALHGDEVLCERVMGRSDDECAVLRIIKRGYSEIVGTFYKDRNGGYLQPDESKFSTEIYIPLYACRKIQSGVKAVAKITDYPKNKAPGGEIIEVLGEADDFFAEELSIIRSYSLKEEFPSDVLLAAEKASNEPLVYNQKRRDFRSQLIVTIDGADTRDIDDAISLEKDGEDYLLGVHIADVSHYVKYRSPLDKEAFERGTSVYFPDCVLPMLPKALSNGICSLNEGEDRYTLSCLMLIDKKGTVKDSEIVEGIICSKHKMTYDEITQILDGDKKVCKKYADVLDTVNLFAELTKILQTNRNKKGCITLDVKEAKILLTKEKEIIIPDYERAFSHQIIEAFMVLANETVAEYMQSIDMPFIYRVHESPNPEKANTFKDYAKTLGLTPRFNAEDVHPYDYQNLLNSAKELPIYPVLNR